MFGIGDRLEKTKGENSKKGGGGKTSSLYQRRRKSLTQLWTEEYGENGGFKVRGRLDVLNGEMRDPTKKSFRENPEHVGRV